MSEFEATETLARLISQRRDHLAQLRKLAARQYQLVQNHEVAKLVSLLAAKQEPLNRLRAIDEELSPFHNDDPDQRVWESPEKRLACRAEADECASLLADVRKLEVASETLMRQRQEEIAKVVDQKTARSQAASEYLKQETGAIRGRDWSLEVGD